MKIDLRRDFADFRDYVSGRIGEYLQSGRPRPKFVHFGFTFDQDGWIFAYLDPRANASWDGEWTTQIQSTAILPRPHWHAVSELRSLSDLVLIDVNGDESQEWIANPTGQNFADILGEFLRSSVSKFEAEGLFEPLLGAQKLDYCVEEFEGLYVWPIDPEMTKFFESLKSSPSTRARGMCSPFRHQSFRKFWRS